MSKHVVIIGAGPAGLTAAYLLSKANIPVTVLEADAEYVGGIARTATYKGFCFDIGGHRFFSKSKEVEALWTEILPDDMLDRPRSSRIYYRKQFFAYPLKPFEALRKLGLYESLLCVLSYGKARLFPVQQVKSFTDWVTNHFGWRLYNIFFKTYTEKVWGMPCEEISSDWAAQRIKGLSLFSALTNALIPSAWRRQKGDVIKTLINTFRYPRKGPGMLWEACAEKIKARGGDIRLGQRVYRCEYHGENNLPWTIYATDAHGSMFKYQASELISTAPLRELVESYLRPLVPPPVLHAARELRYRDFLIVVLILKGQQSFDDNWIYVHDKSVEVGRIQNFKSWSPEMVPDKNLCCYGMEYFCFRDDKTWSATDHLLIEKAKKELMQLGLAKSNDIIDGCVVRQPKAYPVYDAHYQQHVSVIRQELSKRFPSLYLVGRNGMHKYNNQDHAMMTAMLTVENIMAGKTKYDVWCVNQDAEYIEAGNSSVEQHEFGLREVPERIS